VKHFTEAVEYTFSSSAHGILFRTAHMLGLAYYISSHTTREKNYRSTRRMESIQMYGN
jgi:hypothetical protein